MKIRILATSDVHGMVMPYRYSDLKPCNHGFRKLEGVIRKYRNEHTILIDNGDILEGSPLLSYYYKHDDGYKDHLMCELINEMRYDFVNIGNHDLNYGIKVLNKYLDHIDARCINGNLLYSGKSIGNQITVKEIDGVRIAIVGAVTHYLTNWEKEINLKGIDVMDAFEYMSKTVRMIKDNHLADVIIGVYHGGFERDLETGELTEDDTGENQAYRMVKEIEGLDILITGHQHRSIATKCFNTYVTQTAYNASEIAFIEFDTDTKEADVRLLNADSDDYHISSRISDIEEKTEKWLDVTVGEVIDADLKVNDEINARIHKHPVITFINKVTLDASGADLAGNALFNGAVGFNKSITMRDIVSTYIYPNTIVVYEVNGRILKEYLEKSAEYFAIKDEKIDVDESYIYPKPQHYNYDMVDGIDYTIKVSNPKGHRITEIKYHGKSVEDEDIFTLALSNYRSGGGGNFFMFKGCKKVKDIQTDMVTLISEYLLREKKVTLNHYENIKVIK